jgi:predicted NBD/HSP70 family sugar kinase
MNPRSAADIRRGNLFEVLRHIHVDGPVSRQELVDRTHLSMATVANIVTELVERRMVAESAAIRRGAGRPLTRLSTDPAYGLFIGVDVAETYVHASLFDASLNLRAEERVPVRNRARTPRAVVRRITDVVARIAKAADVGKVRGVGISIPGLVDDADGVSVFAPNWNWRQVPIRSLLSEHFSYPVHLDNPLKAIVVSELWRRPDVSGKNLAVINLGTGVGAGLAFGGDLYRGGSNTAGEWGHSTVALDGWPCRCGSTGCVEAYVGAPGLIRHLQQADDKHPALALDEASAIEALAEGVADGDLAAREAIASAGRYLGAGLANLVNTFNPDQVVIAGWVSDLLGEALLEAARTELKARALARPLSAATLTVLPQGGSPVATGAATLALEAALSEDHTEGWR